MSCSPASRTRAATPLETVLQVLEDDPEPPWHLESNANRDLSIIALKCLEKEPARRYGTAAELADKLEHWRRGEPILARRVGVRLKRIFEMGSAASGGRGPAGIGPAIPGDFSGNGDSSATVRSRCANANAQALHREEQTAEEREQARQEALDALASERASPPISPLSTWPTMNGGLTMPRTRKVARRLPGAAPGLGMALFETRLPCRGRRAHGSYAGLYGMHFSPDGSQLLTIGGDGHLRLWHSVTGKPARLRQT